MKSKSAAQTVKSALSSPVAGRVEADGRSGAPLMKSKMKVRVVRHHFDGDKRPSGGTIIETMY
jgi:hypothetical protein